MAVVKVEIDNLGARSTQRVPDSFWKDVAKLTKPGDAVPLPKGCLAGHVTAGMRPVRVVLNRPLVTRKIGDVVHVVHL